jgi:small subunit ribosomal protein S2
MGTKVKIRSPISCADVNNEYMENKDLMKDLMDRGCHFGYSKSRRHPSMKPFIFTTKNRKDIFDLEASLEAFDKALELVTRLGKEKQQILFVGTKPEAQTLIKEAAMASNNPFVTDRWIGGTLTNFKEIQKRTSKLETLRKEKESGDLEKYTKKEQLDLDRLMTKLDRYFGGITIMKDKPAALFVVDPKAEDIAIQEANQLNIPVIAIASSDCNIEEIKFPIPANDAARGSLEYFINKVAETYNAA